MVHLPRFCFDLSLLFGYVSFQRVNLSIERFQFGGECGQLSFNGELLEMLFFQFLPFLISSVFEF